MLDIIDGILPANRVHLVGGVTDAGKTRWIIPAMLQIEKGQPLLGCQTHAPASWLYVAADRLLDEAENTIRTMGLNPTAIRILPAFGTHNKTWLEIILDAQRLTPQPELLIIEGFQDMCDEDRRSVKEFLGRISGYCPPSRDFANGLTIIGICESPKMKPQERYRNPRQRISGVSAWSYHSSTVVMIEAFEKDDALETPNRTVWICPKNVPRRKLAAVFDTQGQLIIP